MAVSSLPIFNGLSVLVKDCNPNNSLSFGLVEKSRGQNREQGDAQNSDDIFPSIHVWDEREKERENSGEHLQDIKPSSWKNGKTAGLDIPRTKDKWEQLKFCIARTKNIPASLRTHMCTKDRGWHFRPGEPGERTLWYFRSSNFLPSHEKWQISGCHAT